MRISWILTIVCALVPCSLTCCKQRGHGARVPGINETHTIVVTRPEIKDVTLSEPFVCQIHSRRHIEIRALEPGYLQAITIKEGQEVKKGEPLFQVIPTIYQTKADAEVANQKLAQLKYNYTKSLCEKNVVSGNEVSLLAVQLAEAEAKADLAKAILNFATVRAPFDGMIDRLHYQQGSLVEEGDILSTLSDNSVMWVYFNVPEARYFQYLADRKQHPEPPKVELILADGSKFNQLGKIAAIEADFNNQNGNVPFRADFPNPARLLRNGQTGTVVLSQVEMHAIVIPQRATFPVFDKLYVYVVDKNHVVHRREIVVKHELEDLFVLKSGVGVGDKIIFEGTRQVHDGQKVQYVERSPKEVDSELKFHAE